MSEVKIVAWQGGPCVDINEGFAKSFAISYGKPLKALVYKSDYDTALSRLAASLAANESLSAELAWSENDSLDQSKELAALREELAKSNDLLGQALGMVNGATDEWHNEAKKVIEGKKNGQ